MGNFANSFVVFTICISICGLNGQRRRPQHIGRPVAFNREGNIQQGNDFSKFFDYHNLAETEDCVHHLCYNMTNYPSDTIKNIIAKKKEYHHHFGFVIEPYTPPSILEKSPISSGTEDLNMCATRQYTHYPQTALNKFSKRVVIVNVDDFKQSVSFEICLSNVKCFMDDHAPLHYETSCKQQYTLIRLVAIAENGNVSLDSIPVPSSCVCTYRRTV